MYICQHLEYKKNYHIFLCQSSMSWASSSEKSLMELSLDEDISSWSLRASSVAYFLIYSKKGVQHEFKILNKQQVPHCLAVCTVTDHRICQNVLRTTVTQSAAPHQWLICSYHSLMSSVIYYWTNTWQHGISLLNWLLHWSDNGNGYLEFLLCIVLVCAGRVQLHLHSKGPQD